MILCVLKRILHKKKSISEIAQAALMWIDISEIAQAALIVDGYFLNSGGERA